MCKDADGIPEETLVNESTYSSQKYSHLNVVINLFLTEAYIDEPSGSWPTACCIAVAGYGPGMTRALKPSRNLVVFLHGPGLATLFLSSLSHSIIGMDEPAHH